MKAGQDIYIVGHFNKFNEDNLHKNSWCVDEDGDLLYFGDNIASSNNYLAAIMTDDSGKTSVYTYDILDMFRQVIKGEEIGEFMQSWLYPSDEERTLFEMDTHYPYPCIQALQGHTTTIQMKQAQETEQWK